MNIQEIKKAENRYYSVLVLTAFYVLNMIIPHPNEVLYLSSQVIAVTIGFALSYKLMPLKIKVLCGILLLVMYFSGIMQLLD